jgi:hypothetical protein
MRQRTGLRVVLALALIAACAACGSSDSGDPVAHVEGLPITRGQLDATVEHFAEEADREGRPFPKKGSDGYESVQRQLLALLVYRAEIVQSARRLGAPVTEEEVERRLKGASSDEGDEDSEGTFAQEILRAQIAYEHVYEKVTVRVPTARRQAAKRAWLAAMKRRYDSRVSYEDGFGPTS